jgi:phage recombination protein Bet
MKVARKFTHEEVALIGRTMMKGASKDDVDLFVSTCERTGLDPFARQIIPSCRNTKQGDNWVKVWTWIVTIDGLRKIAVDSGDYEGQEGPWWCGKDGAWKEIWTEDKSCFAAKVLVHRKGFRTGLAGIARYDAYVQKTKDGRPNSVWATLGDHMTAKCAEALALRRAYPNEMAGLYTEDEQGAAEIVHAAIEEAQDQPPTITWTEEDLAHAKGMVDGLAEELLERGVDGATVQEKTQKPRLTIGDPELTPTTWENRFLGFQDRTLAKFPPPGQAALAAELAQHPA